MSSYAGQEHKNIAVWYCSEGCWEFDDNTCRENIAITSTMMLK
jgi:hypothetical protein